MIWTLATIAAFVFLTCLILSTISLMQIAYDISLIKQALSPPEEYDANTDQNS